MGEAGTNSQTLQVQRLLGEATSTDLTRAMLLALGKTTEAEALATAGCDGLFAFAGWADTPQRVNHVSKSIRLLADQYSAAGHANEAAALQQRLASWLETKP